MLNAAIARARTAIEAERRSTERFDVYLKTALFENGALAEPVILVNLSETGCLARSAARHRINGHVAIYLPGLGQIPSITRWSGNGMLGCEFEQPIARDHFILLLDVIMKAGHS